MKQVEANWKYVKGFVKDVIASLVEYGTELVDNGEDREEIEYSVRSALVQDYNDDVYAITDNFSNWEFDEVVNAVISDVMDWIDEYIDEE